MPLPTREVRSRIANRRVQLELCEPRLDILGRIVRRNEPCPPERVVQGRVVPLAHGIEVLAHGPGVEEGVLRDDGQFLAERIEADGGDVVAVDDDGSGGELDDAEEGLEEGGLGCDGAERS